MAHWQQAGDTYLTLPAHGTLETVFDTTPEPGNVLGRSLTRGAGTPLPPLPREDASGPWKMLSPNGRGRWPGTRLPKPLSTSAYATYRLCDLKEAATSRSLLLGSLG